MTGYDLKLWRREFNWCQEIASERLGITRRTYIRYEKNYTKKIPTMLELATQAISIQQRYNEMKNKSKDAILNNIALTLKIKNCK